MCEKKNKIYMFGGSSVETNLVLCDDNGVQVVSFSKRTIMLRLKQQ